MTAAPTPSRRGGLIASAFVVLALLALVAVPRLIEAGSRRVREDIERAADPARTHVTQVQYALARQTAALRGFLLSGDSSHLHTYEDYAGREREAYRVLRPAMRRLGPQARYFLARLERLSTMWHEAVARELAAGPTPLRPGALPFEQQVYLDALHAATELDRAILVATAERRDVVAAVRRRAEWIQAALAVVALAAALVAARLGMRFHALAHEAEARRGQAEAALEESARAVDSRARLLRGITHDVKNPLSAADAYAEILTLGIKGPLSDAQAEVIAGIRRSIRQANEILQDLLDLSYAESGALSIERDVTSLPMVARELVEEYSGAAHAARHQLELRLPRERVVVYTDEARVRQVLGNLVGNAIKYTPPGGRVEVQVVPGRDGGVPRPGRWAAVRVVDTGPGIAPEDQGRIFEEFERLPGTVAAGHGLGLTISRRIARLLGGDVTVDSRPGGGSTFTLWIPVRAGGEEAT